MNPEINNREKNNAGMVSQVSHADKYHNNTTSKFFKLMTKLARACNSATAFCCSNPLSVISIPLTVSLTNKLIYDLLGSLKAARADRCYFQLELEGCWKPLQDCRINIDKTLAMEKSCAELKEICSEIRTRCDTEQWRHELFENTLVNCFMTGLMAGAAAFVIDYVYQAAHNQFNHKPGMLKMSMVSFFMGALFYLGLMKINDTALGFDC
ncbi:hypothetical protein [Sodalis sp. C49]|uniref:hypothetical protein n=1 Tax=unclassified Sodalis (in: enterobacteria) TaxID=2636512 RepID=UPI003965B062